MKNIMKNSKKNKPKLLLLIFTIFILTAFFYKPRLIYSNKYLDNFLINLGFVVKKIDIIGLKNLDKNQIIKNISYYDCLNLLCLNLKQTKQKLENIAWIESVKLNLDLPSGLRIVINEEKASFILKKEEYFSVLNFEGKVLESGPYLNLKYSNLLVLDGNGVKNNIYDLIKILDTSPELAKNITDATLISKRRWSLIYDSNIIIDLPEIEPEKAFKQISDLNKKHGLLSNKLEKIDLRLDNRMIIKMKTINKLLKESKV